MERWTKTFTLEECIKACDKFQVPCGPVYSISDIFKDPHYAARENILRMKDQEGEYNIFQVERAYNIS